MAIMRISFKSEILGENLQMNIVLPREAKCADLPWILLLHGLSGSQDDWTRFTSAERYANQYGFALVMPYGGPSRWYSNCIDGKRWFDFIATEVPRFARLVAPLSRKRSKTFVAGLSMGGYGALKVGLRNPSRFSAIASFSGVLDIAMRFCSTFRPESVAERSANARSVWGEDFANVLSTKRGHREDLFSLVSDTKWDEKAPWIFTACGTEDSLYGMNKAFDEHIRKFPATYKHLEEPGVHEWRLWDKWLPMAMEFFTTKMASDGVQVLK